MDGGFLELVRLGILPASDPTVRASVAVIDRTLERSTPSGPGFYRYGTSAGGSEDGYGDCYEPDPTSCSLSGKPWPPANVGSGHASLGSPQLIIDQAGGTATWVLPRSAFGTVGGGWVFTVALTGQAGSEPDQARAFAATAQPFAFGVAGPG